jgi:predicted esterase
VRALLSSLVLTAVAAAQGALPGKVVVDELAPKTKRDDPLVYAVYAPMSYKDGKPAPLMLAIHAGTGSARQFCGFLRPAAEAQGALLVCPQGFREVVGADGYWWKNDKAEWAALDRLLAHAKKTYHVDETRITLVGLADGAELGLHWGLAKDRGLQGIIALNFLWKLKGSPRASKTLKVCLIASAGAKEKKAMLADHAAKAHKALVRAKQPVVLRVVPGTSRSFFHGWETEFRNAYKWFGGTLDWPAELAKKQKQEEK